MTGSWTVAPVAVALLVSGTNLPAQQVANRANAYLFPTDVSDARAIWVNPAGLGMQREASIYAEVAVGDPGSKGRLRQINAGFNSRGLSFGYQRDLLDNGGRANTYRFGLAGGSGGLRVSPWGSWRRISASPSCGVSSSASPSCPAPPGIRAPLRRWPSLRPRASRLIR